MPRGDNTGPEGAGPMTGRRIGSCSVKAPSESKNPVQGRRGGAQRNAWGFHAFPPDYQTATQPEINIKHRALESEREVLLGQLEEIELQLSAMGENEEIK